MRKAATYLLTTVLNLNKLTESKIGQCTIRINISTNKYWDKLFFFLFFTIFFIIIDIIYCNWYCIIKVVSMMDKCKTNVFLITTYPLINLYIYKMSGLFHTYYCTQSTYTHFFCTEFVTCELCVHYYLS